MLFIVGVVARLAPAAALRVHANALRKRDLRGEESFADGLSEAAV
jgi:hypothetical protein